MIGAGIIAIGAIALAAVGLAQASAAFAAPDANSGNTFSAMMWDDIVSVTAGDAHSWAAKAEGSVWCWGKGGNGQLGDNTGDDSDYPVQVTGSGGTGTFSNGILVGSGTAHTCAAKDDESVWCWGKGDKGQLGDNTGNDSDYPVEAPL